MTPYRKYYQAAGITICVESKFEITTNTFLPKFKLFEIEDPGFSDVKIRHHFNPYDLKNTKTHQHVFTNEQWNIFKINDGWMYQFEPFFPHEPGLPVTAIINNNHTLVDVFIENISKQSYQNGQHNALTLFNSDQVLFSKLLCDREGLIIHSNGFNIHGSGILIAGQSGAGKSTLSGMLKKQGHKILCDDRMFIKKQENTFWIYGSWCHGSVPDVAKASAPLGAVFFLKQASVNKLEYLNDKKIVSHNLMHALVKPFFGKEDWFKTIDIVNRLVKTIDFYYVHFDLTGKICTGIEALMKSK